MIEICTNVLKVTNVMSYCRLLAKKEEGSNSLEKMGNCLQRQFLLHVSNKGSASGTFCVVAKNVISTIQTCKKSSNTVDEFDNCLMNRIVKLKYGVSITKASQPGKNSRIVRY